MEYTSKCPITIIDYRCLRTYASQFEASYVGIEVIIHVLYIQVSNAQFNVIATGVVAQIWGAIIGTVVAGPLGGAAGYAIGSGVVDGVIASFEATRTTNYTRY